MTAVTARGNIDQRIAVFSREQGVLILPRSHTPDTRSLFHNQGAVANSEIVAERYLAQQHLSLTALKAVACYGCISTPDDRPVCGYGLEPVQFRPNDHSYRGRDFMLEKLDMDDGLLESCQEDGAGFDEYDRRFVIASFKHLPRYRRAKIDL